MDDEAKTIEAHRVRNGPPSMYYISNFISEAEEASLLNTIPPNRWVSLAHRRLQAVPARLTATNTLLASPLPLWLTEPIISRLHNLGIFANSPHGVNHCLINEYLPGQGIMPHEDGSAYHPIVATVSLGAGLVLDVHAKRAADAPPPRADTAWRIFQEPRSLLVTTGAAYTDTLHGIADVAEDRDLSAATVANWDLLESATTQRLAADEGVHRRAVRVSLTFRDVRKVSTVGSKIFGRPKK